MQSPLLLAPVQALLFRSVFPCVVNFVAAGKCPITPAGPFQCKLVPFFLAPPHPWQCDKHGVGTSGRFKFGSQPNLDLTVAAGFVPHVC